MSDAAGNAAVTSTDSPRSEYDHNQDSYEIEEQIAAPFSNQGNDGRESRVERVGYATVISVETAKEKTLLYPMTIEFPDGAVTEIMGPSGSGKKTLLDFITGCFSGSVRVSGEVNLPGAKAYVPQDDRLHGFYTCEGYMKHYTRLSGQNVTNETRNQIHEILESLGLKQQKDIVIGDVFLKGLSGGQKRRLSIALEALSSPKNFFLDEPTSGLDSESAYQVMKFLKEYAQAAPGRRVILTIHQPRSFIWKLVDNAVLVSKGKLMFQGPRSQLESFFKFAGSPTPPEFNPADHYVSVVNDEFTLHEKSVDEWAEKFEEYQMSPTEVCSRSFSAARNFMVNVKNKQDISTGQSGGFCTGTKIRFKLRRMSLLLLNQKIGLYHTISFLLFVLCKRVCIMGQCNLNVAAAVSPESFRIVSSSIFDMTLHPTFTALDLSSIRMIEETTSSFLAAMLDINLTNENQAALVHLDEISTVVTDFKFSSNAVRSRSLSDVVDMFMYMNRVESEARKKSFVVTVDKYSSAVHTVVRNKAQDRLLQQGDNEESQPFTVLKFFVKAKYSGDLSYVPEGSNYLDALIISAFGRKTANALFTALLSASQVEVLNQVSTVEVKHVSPSSMSDGSPRGGDEVANKGTTSDGSKKNEDSTEEPTKSPEVQSSSLRKLDIIDIIFLVISISVVLATGFVIWRQVKKRPTHAERIRHFTPDKENSRALQTNSDENEINKHLESMRKFAAAHGMNSGKKLKDKQNTPSLPDGSMTDGDGDSKIALQPILEDEDSVSRWFDKVRQSLTDSVSSQGDSHMCNDSKKLEEITDSGSASSQEAPKIDDTHSVASFYEWTRTVLVVKTPTAKSEEEMKIEISKV